MKLTRLYSNQAELFLPVQFNEQLSVVLAEIRRTENKGKTIHNIGKSTIARLVDFCLLKGKSQKFFLFKHSDLFSEFTFFLELNLEDGRYLTIARSVEATKPISILVTDYDVPDAKDVNTSEWSHIGLGMAPAKRLLDGLFDFSSISPYDYRDILGYVLREQDDYGEVFHLGKFKGPHREWKPFLAKLLGLDDSLTISLYEETDKEAKVDASISIYQLESGLTDKTDTAKIEGIIGIRKRELEEIQSTLDSLDFTRADSEASQELVEHVEEQISIKNEESYRLSQLAARLDDSLREESILFSPKQAKKLFAEAGIAFDGQIKHDFEQLIQFNRAISQERREYLLKEKSDTAARLSELGPELADLQLQRADLLSFLGNSATMEKFKDISNQVVELRAGISSLERQRDALNEVVRLRQEKRQIQERESQLQTAIEQDVRRCAEDPSSRYSEIQRYFDKIIYDVLDEHALLSVDPSPTGALEFSAEIVSPAGSTTSASRGFTFKKLLCIAFDLAVLRSYRFDKFPRFSYHDGVFESLEPRAKRRLISVFREYAELGLQPIITTLDSDLPDPVDSSDEAISSSEIVRRLHDDGKEGRLFRIDSF
ncbi:DUF2326 domain-containing protein [Bifidobacterium psychraerophilum]|uniref:DUF2326 domain-containing protein n=1 Tax=Bifidobacterium psychraerophilum TaxID=218140 RepID=A0A087CCP3_9BIFI|nr:DUF2326 domain-containing protein [Bifidobacterium psychraerophilum]KFI81043.1 hypothetical protein BPSY_1451 [Bifidobacterium psychraerophilum]PKA95388.1 uncharacterized protein YydD (DUF2326 family) [Bifidobacterium psychraerophilum DSM 22366]